MRELEDALAWATLAAAPALSVATVATALERLHHPAALLNGSEALWDDIDLLPVTRDYLTSKSVWKTKTLPRWLNGTNNVLIPFNDSRFPASLRSLTECPLALYVSGRIESLNEPQLAMVGSRRPTAQGRENAMVFASALSERGICITSGMAEGIDACSHRGALDVQGNTLGIVGAGIDVVYPRSNQLLFAEVARYGTLASELPLGEPPKRQHFPRRNRLIAALGMGTLVVEAAQRSGSLLTAALARRYGRPVFAVPGSIHNPLSRGCHALIKNGAALVENAADVLRRLNFSTCLANGLAARPAAFNNPGNASGMDKHHKILLDALGFDPVDLDSLILRTGLKPEAVSSMILILELEGHVQAAPGGRYSRVVSGRAGVER